MDIQPYNPFMVEGKLTTEDKKFEETYGKAFVDAKEKTLELVKVYLILV